MRQTLDLEDSPEEIQGCLNCTRPASACDNCGGPNSRRVKRGVWTDMQIINECIERFERGYPANDVAAKYGVSAASVYRWSNMRKEGIL